MKMPEGDHRWLPKREIVRIAGEQGFTLAAHRGRILLPKKIPFLSPLLNRLAEKNEGLAPVCLTHVYIFTTGGSR